MPRVQRDQLEADIRDAKESVYAAEASLQAVIRFPPLVLR